MMMRSSFNTNAARLSPNNNGAVTIRTSADSTLGTLRIGRIASLARGASVSSSGNVSIGGSGFSPSARLDSLRFGGTMKEKGDGDEVEVSVNGKKVTLSTDEITNAFGSGNVAEIEKDGMILTFRKASTKSLGFEFDSARLAFNNYRASATDVNGNSVSISQDDFDKLSWGDWTSSFKAGDTDVKIIRTGEGEDAKYKISVDGGTTFQELTFDKDGNPVNGVEIGKDDEGEPIFLPITQVEDGSLRLGGNITIGFSSEATMKVAVGKDDEGETIYADVKLSKGENGQVRSVNEETGASRLLGEFIGETSINVNGDVRLTSNMTINQMVAAVNDRDRGAGVTMAYDRMTDRFTITSNTVNSSADDLNISGLGMFGLSQDDVKGGTMAVVYINGQRVESQSNTFDFRGVNITLNRVTEGSGELVGGVPEWMPEDDIVLTVERNVDAVVDRIKNFIEAYNSIISKIEGLLNERKTRAEQSYRPLTDDEKAAMTERQIEQWEAIARKGILRDDHGLKSLASSLRREMFNAIDGVGMSASDIGLTTGNFWSGTGGQIQLDEDRLRAALEEDPDRVADIFIRIGSNDEDGTRKGFGFLRNVDNILNEYVRTNGIQSRTLRSLEASIRRENEQIFRMQQRMFNEEDRLYRQFASMETALSRLQSQGDWFGAMMGSMQQR